MMKWLLLAIVTVALLLPVTGAAESEDRAQQEDPVELTREVTDQLLQRIKEDRDRLDGNEAALRELVDELLLPHVDVVFIARVVLARHWRTASEEQRREFISAFRDALIRSYASALLAYDNQEIRFLALRDDPAEGDVRVRMEFVPHEGEPLPVVFRMHQRGSAQWRVYDVVVENISLVTNFRGAFDSEIRRNGLDSLISKLKSDDPDSELVDPLRNDENNDG